MVPRSDPGRAALPPVGILVHPADRASSNLADPAWTLSRLGSVLSLGGPHNGISHRYSKRDRTGFTCALYRRHVCVKSANHRLH